MIEADMIEADMIEREPHGATGSVGRELRFVIRDIPRTPYPRNFSKTSCAKNLLLPPQCK
jgi:hypothetical protein